MITFGIPLKGPSASEDWKMTCSLFLRTLRSVTSQTIEHWHAIVACDVIPPIPEKYLDDERIEFIVMPSKYPLGAMDDKGRKVNAIASRHRMRGGGYLMLVDADDLVSNRIAELCENSHAFGFCSKTGYLYFEGSRFLRVVRDPWKICGSCTIVNWRPEDLPPHSVNNLEELKLFRKQYIINASHDCIPRLMAEEGRPLSTVPFVLSIYSCGNGENNSISSEKTIIKAALKNLLRSLHPIKRLSLNEVSEFSLYPAECRQCEM